MKDRIYFAIFLILLGIVATCSTIVPVYWQNNKMKKQANKIQKEILDLKEKREYYIQQKRTIEKDPGYIEYLLRNKLYYGKKGEKILD